ncbi:MAG: ferredoxin-type protein NapF [Desulfobulbaceae bacterium]
MNLASFLANKCFEYLLNCDVEKGGGRFLPRRGTDKSPASYRLLPPWALAEQVFRAKCDHCHACLDRCENKILITDSAGCPVVDFSRGFCNFCGACVKSCPVDLFRPLQSLPPWSVKAVVTAACLAHNNVLCRTCAEHCPEDAIIFPKQAGTISAPRILAERCNGCGACYSPCPTGAIDMRKGDENHDPGGNG